MILPVTAANGGHFRVTVNVAATAHWSVVAGACALNASPTLYDSCEGDASVALFIRIAFLDGGNRSGERGQELVLIDNGSIAGGFCQFGYCTNFTSAYLSGSAAVTGTFTVALNGSFAQTNGTVQVTLIPDVIVVDQPFFTTLLGASSVATLRATVTIASIVQW